MTTSVLSPLAAPFQPTMTYDAEFLIFNDGVPSYVCEETEVIRGVSDEAIEDHFPPTMEELREIEETEFFVEMLASLDLYEEREERSREFADVKKRWAARRKEGIPVGGRPRKPREHKEKEVVSGVTMVNHHKTSSDIVSFDNERERKFHHHGDSALMNARTMNRVRDRVSKHPAKNVMGMHGYSKPIQQPRK